MPRYRTLCDEKRRKGYSHVSKILTALGLAYPSVVYSCIWPILIQSFWIGIPLFVLFTILFALMMISFYQCMVLHPGKVPKNWGFYMGDEAKRRRYCRMCNVWKPDRTHHCSTCGQCVLNMDHHCPWLNNCIGFWNRKFFIQLLSYAFMANVLCVCLFITTVPMTAVPFMKTVGILRTGSEGFHAPFSFDDRQPSLKVSRNDGHSNIPNVLVTVLGSITGTGTPSEKLTVSDKFDLLSVSTLDNFSSNEDEDNSDSLDQSTANGIASHKRLLKEQIEEATLPLNQHYGYMGNSKLFGIVKFVEDDGKVSGLAILRCLILFPIVHFWDVISVLVCVGVFAMIVPLGRFLYFHISLVLTNMTTLETMEAEDKLRQANIDPNSEEAKNSKIMKSKYDIGSKRNWEQVMGIDKWSWFLPFVLRTGFPQGDGVRWRVHYSRIVDEEDES
eukprot:GDKJ01015604.1.p1 GENE.GDKJ01015604.1~~GDKJ01015604.1.p1  ORF type:complete len:444 (-),score=56.24 GDKJ01015604.1:87-1418(-)